jgi:hypothetical protein
MPAEYRLDRSLQSGAERRAPQGSSDRGGLDGRKTSGDENGDVEFLNDNVLGHNTSICGVHLPTAVPAVKRSM